MKSSNPIFTHPVLRLLQKCKTINTLKQVHTQMILTGLALHTYPLGRLLSISSSITITYTLSIFNQIENPTIFLFNTVISSLTNRKDTVDIAFSLYERVLSHRALKPNNFTYPSLFKACWSHPWVKHGLALHTHVLKFLEPSYDHFVQASLLNYYANCGKLGVARYLFDQISNPDLAAWNSILAAYARNDCCLVNMGSDDNTGFPMETLCLFNEMQNSLVRPNEITLVALISACANLGALNQGAWAHAYALKNNLNLNLFVGTALIQMYSKCGCLDLACQLFDQMPQRDTLCYNAMIGGLAIHGCGHRALDLYEKMKVEGLVPDNVTFVVTMCACSHVGLVNEGCKIFESIKGVYGFEPTIEHYGCVIDLLGRVGRLKEAIENVIRIPMKPNAILWRSLLGAARVHGNFEIAEIAMKHLVELEPETSGNYVLLSNMYASIDKWEHAKRVRKLMKDHGIIKVPGSSLVQINGAMHVFITGDKTHPCSKEIYLKVEEMNRALQQYGNKPSLKGVLDIEEEHKQDAVLDIEEEQKQDAMSNHSENLTIAFALMV